MLASEEMNFCPRCGHTLIDAEQMGALRRTCPDCGFIHFRDPKVAAVVFIVEDGKVLLVKRSVDPQSGKWALPAGYIDYGEDPREAAIREVAEETGLQVTITRIIDILGPDRSPNAKASIILLFEARVEGGVLVPQDDVEDAVFFLPEDVPFHSIAFESTHHQLTSWLGTLG